jgi:hypothetical protein
MSGRLRMHDVVALLEATPMKHFESGEPIILRRGQIGTVVMTYEDGACDVEFADRNGRTYALLTLLPDKLLVLHETPEHIAA